MKLALGLDVQTNAKGGKIHVNFQDDGAKRVGVCFAGNTDLELWTEEVEQGVIDNMIVFQKPFPGAARTELESQLQRAVKVSAKGKHVKCKIDLERCLFWDQGPRAGGGPARVADGQAVGRALRGAPPHAGGPGGAVLPVLGLQQLGARGPRSVRWQDSRRGLAGWPAAAPGSSAACRCPASLRPAATKTPWVSSRRPQ